MPKSKFLRPANPSELAPPRAIAEIRFRGYEAARRTNAELVLKHYRDIVAGGRPGLPEAVIAHSKSVTPASGPRGQVPADLAKQAAAGESGKESSMVAAEQARIDNHLATMQVRPAFPGIGAMQSPAFHCNQQSARV